MAAERGPGVQDAGRLERDGLVESEEGAADGPQKRFRITSAGEAELAAWLRTPPDLTSPPRDELVMKILVVVRVPGTDVHEVIQAHRLYLMELMQQWTRLKDGEARGDLGLALAVDAELFRLDAVTRWLDAADARLTRAAAAPARARSGHIAAAAQDRGTTVSVLSSGGLEDLRAGRGRVHALAAVSLTVQAGEMVAVMGPSGSGKSATLLTVAGSLEEPTSGEVLVCGTDLATLPRNGKARLRRRVIGYVFQEFNLLPGLTAAENVSLPLELEGVALPGPGRPGWRRWSHWAWPGERPGSLGSYPVASGSGWLSPARWSETAACCWPTSRPARWTR